VAEPQQRRQVLQGVKGLRNQSEGHAHALPARAALLLQEWPKSLQELTHRNTNKSLAIIRIFRDSTLSFGVRRRFEGT